MLMALIKINSVKPSPRINLYPLFLLTISCSASYVHFAPAAFSCEIILFCVRRKRKPSVRVYN